METKTTKTLKESKRMHEIDMVLTLAHDSYCKGLCARAFFKINDHDLGDDLVQDTFLKTWIYLKKGGEINIMRSFLYHVLNDLIVDEYRKIKAEKLDALIENGLDPSDDSNLPEHLYNTLDGRIALKLISKLPKKYGSVIRMKYIKSMTTSEISKATGQSKNLVAVCAHRGIEKIKELYEPRKLKFA